MTNAREVELKRRMLQELKADKWDEGYSAGWCNYADMRGDDPTPNPYRTADPAAATGEGEA